MAEPNPPPPPAAASFHGQIAFLLVLGVVAAAFLYHMVTRTPPVPRVSELRTLPKKDLKKEIADYLEEKQARPLTAPLGEVLRDPGSFAVKTEAHPLLGKTAPDFTLPDHEGQPFKLSDQFARGPVVLAFYYGYHCDHCVGQLVALNKDLALFRELGAEVVAVSPDEPVKTRQSFADYGAFAFPTLSDPDGKVARRYDVLTDDPKYGEVLYHATLVLDRDGQVVWSNRGFEPFVNNRALLYEVAKLQGKAAPTAGGD